MKWEMVRLGELVEKVKTCEPSVFVEGSHFKYVDIAAIDLVNKKVNEVKTLPLKEAPSRARQIVEVNDVLVSTVRPNLNAIAIFEDDAENTIASTGFCILRPNRNKLESKFLYYWVQTIAFIKRMIERATGASYPAVSDSIIKNEFIPLPPLPTQQKIAAILDAADNLRRKDRQLLAHYDTLLQSIFHQLFGDPVRNEKGWDIKPLGELCADFKYGTNQKSFEVQENNAVPIIRIPNVLNGAVNYEDFKYSVLSEKELKDVKLAVGDLLFVRTNGNPNYIGRCAVFNGDVVAGYASYLIRTRVKSVAEVSPVFLQTMISFKTYRPLVLRKTTTTAGNYNINTVALKSLPVYVPPIKLQNHFATIAQNIQQQKDQINQQLHRSESLFQTLLQKAFKGELVS